MNCEEIKAKLSLYLDGMLPQKEAQLVGEHLNSCESCRKEEKELSEIRRLLGQIPQEPVPDVFWKRMDQALSEEKKEKKSYGHQSSGVFLGRKRLWRTVAGAAAVFLVCLLSYSFFSDHLSLPDNGAGQNTSQQLNADGNSITDQTSNQPDQQANQDQSGQASTGGNLSDSKEKQNSGSNPSPKAAETPTLSKAGKAPSIPKTAPATPKTASASSAPKSEASSSAPKYEAASAPSKSEAASAAPKSGAASEPAAAFSLPLPAAEAPISGSKEPITENQLRSRGFSMENDITAAACDGAVSNLVDAMNQQDQKKMEQSIGLAGYTDQLKDRAKVALSFYQTVFGGSTVTWEFVKEEPMQTNPSQNDLQQMESQSMVRQYKLSNKNTALMLTVTLKDDVLTLQEGILQYSYELDQAMADVTYQLKKYTSQNEAGCPEFTLTLKKNSTGTDQTITFVGSDGKVSRKDETQPAPAKAPDNREEK